MNEQTYQDRPTMEKRNELVQALGGRAQCAVGSYVSDGKSGTEHPTTITFPFTPKLVLVFRSTSTSLST